MSPKFTPPSPQELNPYFPDHTVTDFIAKGGMGAVYLAHETALDRLVAIKVLPRERGNTQNQEAFETEARAMLTLEHPNLLRAFDYGDLGDLYYIVMEYHPGRSLFAKAHKRSVDMLEAAELISKICIGLNHAHSAGLVHRDIKPSNILLDDEALPTIVDFGLARPLDNTHGGGQIYGTPGYTAPEVIHSPHSIDQRADIFSAGIMLYELLTGRKPPQPYISASTISDSHEDFDVIILKAIHPHRDFRYSNATEMADELTELMEMINDPKKAKAKKYAHTAPQSVQPPKTAPLALTPLGASLQGTAYRMC